MKKCRCTFINGGWLNHECQFHATHCHEFMCKKKSLKLKEYCKEHQGFWDNYIGDPEGYGGSDF